MYTKTSWNRKQKFYYYVLVWLSLFLCLALSVGIRMCGEREFIIRKTKLACDSFRRSLLLLLLLLMMFLPIALSFSESFFSIFQNTHTHATPNAFGDLFIFIFFLYFSCIYSHVTLLLFSAISSSRFSHTLNFLHNRRTRATSESSRKQKQKQQL